jgi:pyruvate,water dikinase
VLERPDDVFYLEVEEVRGFVKGTTTLTDLRSLVRARRAEFDRWRRMPPPPDHFVTYGAVNAGNSFEPETAPAAATADATKLSGLGACPGIVEADAVVLLEPDATSAVEGSILVTYQTDPGWVVLFPSIRGLAVERGSMLSHSAIVAREMGIPAVVGVRDLVRTIRTGDRVRLDGAKGTIEVLTRRAVP